MDSDVKDRVLEPEAAPEQAVSLVQEFFWFLREDRKWWHAPLIAMMLVLGGAMAVAVSPLGPFLYTLF